MTELLYQTNAYMQETPARVVETNPDKNAVLLDRTVFYPGGGGQPADRGVLKASEDIYTVSGVQRGNWHVITGELPSVGTEVVAQIDWTYRYSLMRIHTALHVLCGVVWHEYGASVTGGNMEPLKGRMDFEFERLQKDLVSEIEERINAEAGLEHDVVTQLLPREEAFQIPDLIRTKINLLPEGITQIRTVEIVDLDLQACGGTHLANTREIGTIRVRDYKSKGGINKRIYIELDT